MIIKGTTGNDLKLGFGVTTADTISGLTGSDTYYVNNIGDKVVEGINAGIDTVISFINTYTLAANVENLTLATGGVNGTGNSLNNTILGNSAANKLSGLDGNDKINAGAGNDQIDGGKGNDQLFGNAGDDKINGGDGNDVLVAGDGADTLTGGEGKDIYNLSETKPSTDVIITGTETSLDVNHYITSFDVVRGFTLGQDKLDATFANILTDRTTPTFGQHYTPGLDFGSIVSHTTVNGIMSFFNAANQQINVNDTISATTATLKQALSYVVDNMPQKGEVAGFLQSVGTTGHNTFVVQHDHTGTVENHVITELVGVAATSLSSTAVAGSVWIV